MDADKRTPETQTGDRFYREPEAADYFEVRRDLATGELTTAPPEMWPPSNGVDTGADTVHPVTAETIAMLVAEISRLSEALIDAEARAIQKVGTEWGVRAWPDGDVLRKNRRDDEQSVRKLVDWYQRNGFDPRLARREVADWREVQ